MWGNTAPHARSGGSDEHADQLERIAVYTAVTVSGVVALLWLTGQVAALLCGHGWPTGSGAAGLHALARWPHHLADPPAAYPSHHPLAATPPALWWATLVALTVAGVVVGRIVWRRHRHRSGCDDNHWATAADLRGLTVRRATQGRLVMGRVGRRLVATEARHSLLVIGPTQSGKTSGLAVPALLEWEGPAVAVSVKTDLAEHTIGCRSRLGETWVYDPRQTTQLPAATWSPISAIDTWEDAIRVAGDLTEAGRSHSGDGMQQAGFWFGLAAQLLAPYLYAAARSERTMADVYQWILTHDHTVARATLTADGHPTALAQHDSMWNIGDQTASSVFVTLQEALRVYADGRVSASTATSDVTPADLFGTYRTLYVAAPAKDQQALQPLFSTLIGHVIDQAFAHVAASGRPLDPPLLVIVDEAANVAPMRNLAQIASTAAAQGIQLVTIWQDLAQIRDRYHQQANTVLNNHRGRLLLAGCGDQDTLQWASTTLGVTGPRRNGRRDTAARGDDRHDPLLTLDHARRMPGHHAVLLYGTHHPAKLRLRAWHKDRRLRSLAVTQQLR
jgi:type IV secretion system protein VirD4